MDRPLYREDPVETHIYRLGRRVRRDQDVMTGADAGDMRIPVLRGLAAAAVVAGLASGCTGAPSSQPTSPAQTARSAQRTRWAEGRTAVPGNRGVPLRVAERAAGSVRLGAGAAVAAGRRVRCRLGPARRTPLPDRRSRRAGSAVRPAARRPSWNSAARLPAGDVGPARHRGGGTGLPGAAAADGRIGLDGARTRRGPLVRGGHRAGPAVLRHRGYGRRHRGAAGGARRRPAHRGRGLRTAPTSRSGSRWPIRAR